MSDELTENWLNLFVHMEEARQDKKAVYRQIMSGIGPRTCYLQVLAQSVPVGIGMSVCERGWAGLYSVATAAHYRRRGVGTEIVRSLAEWAAQHGATQLYLQVMKNNAPALALYEKLGFSHLYSYHYRTLG
jgi:ribosomal protein S18 acetylase RimI-like enzyme